MKIGRCSLRPRCRPFHESMGVHGDERLVRLASLRHLIAVVTLRKRFPLAAVHGGTA